MFDEVSLIFQTLMADERAEEVRLLLWKRRETYHRISISFNPSVSEASSFQEYRLTSMPSGMLAMLEPSRAKTLRGCWNG